MNNNANGESIFLEGRPFQPQAAQADGRVRPERIENCGDEEGEESSERDTRTVDHGDGPW